MLNANTNHEQEASKAKSLTQAGLQSRVTGLLTGPLTGLLTGQLANRAANARKLKLKTLNRFKWVVWHRRKKAWALSAAMLKENLEVGAPIILLAKASVAKA